MKTSIEMDRLPSGTVVAWVIYYNDDDSLYCITMDADKAEVCRQMNYTVVPLKK